MNLLEDLKWRGLVYDVINEEELEKRLEEKPITLYCGFDPTADSLHIGSLLPIVTLLRFQKAGHRIVALVGGGTGLIGDPSGKRSERLMNEVEVVQGWVELFKKQFSRFIEFDNKTAFCIDNYEWLGSMSALEMWRNYGKHFSVNVMLQKDSVKSRLENGLTYLEFSYMIMQSIDFLKMYQDKDLKCEMQIGGQDQWGNITAGMDLIRRVEGSEAKVFGLTMPLITKSDGSKFGKTESGAVWLDEEKTTPYEMYQFFYNTADLDAVKFLKYYTFLDKEEIEKIEEEFNKAPHQRLAQKVLAEEVVTLCHGKDAFIQAKKVSEALFSGEIASLNASDINVGFKDVPSIEVTEDINLIDLLVEVKAASSKREAREFIKNGAVSINGVVQKEFEFLVTKRTAIEEKFSVIRRGKKNYYLVKHI
ncbi:MAG: tyrosine--tRNA ligase [Bacilli bacterium]|nr:tyrosine--tRNA ligase [Bacilli bacterium]